MKKGSSAAPVDELDEDAAEVAEAAAIEAAISSPRRWSHGLILLLGALGLQRLAALTPGLVESLYSSFFYQYLIRVLSLFSKPFTYSLAEFGLILLVLALLGWLGWLARKVWKGLLSVFELVIFLVYRAIWVGGGALLLFLVLWGFNYQREVVATNLNLAGRETRPGELEAICNLLITRLNTNYDAAHAGREELPANQLPLSKPQLYEKLEQSYQTLKLLGRTSEGGFGPPKPLLLSAVLSRFGISGIYSPFTGEANYNEESPACDLPYVIAHEKAHQRGFAREDEANFIGLLACLNANDPFIRYSGYLQAMPRVMNVLANVNEEDYRTLATRIGPGPRADLQSRAAFWNLREHRVLGEVARRTNHTYLRANRIRSGIANYDEVTALILNFFIAYPTGLTDQAAPRPATEQRATEQRATESAALPAMTPTATASSTPRVAPTSSLRATPR